MSAKVLDFVAASKGKDQRILTRGVPFLNERGELVRAVTTESRVDLGFGPQPLPIVAIERVPER